jgi:hypothetical protein
MIRDVPTIWTTKRIKGRIIQTLSTGQLRSALVRDRRASPHHVFPCSGWISFWIRDGEDVRPAIDLIQIACAYRENAG